MTHTQNTAYAKRVEDREDAGQQTRSCLFAESKFLSHYDRRRLTMMDWLFAVNVLPPSVLRAGYGKYMDALGISTQAASFLRTIVPALGSKEDLVRLCFEHLDLPRERTVLSYIDLEIRTTEEIPI